jgi:hypothetical protein
MLVYNSNNINLTHNHFLSQIMKKIKTYDVGNPYLGQKGGGVEKVNGIPILTM